MASQAALKKQQGGFLVIFSFLEETIGVYVC